MTCLWLLFFDTRSLKQRARSLKVALDVIFYKGTRGRG